MRAIGGFKNMRNKNAKITKKDREELFRFLQKAAGDESLLRAFVYDILTPAEINELVARLQIVKLLARGLTQREVAEKLHVSIQTVTRGAKALGNSQGAFTTFSHWWRSQSPRASAT